MKTRNIPDNNTFNYEKRVRFLKDSYLASQRAKKVDSDDSSATSDASTQSLSTADALEENEGKKKFTTLREVVEEIRKRKINSNENEVVEELYKNSDEQRDFGNSRQIVEKEDFTSKVESNKNGNLQRKNVHQNAFNRRSSIKEVTIVKSEETYLSDSFPKEKEQSLVEALKKTVIEKELQCRKLQIELSVLRAFRKTVSGQCDHYENEGNVANELRRLIVENEKLVHEVEMLRLSHNAGSDTTSLEDFHSDDVRFFHEDDNDGLKLPSSIGERRAHPSSNSNKHSKIRSQDDTKRGLMSCSILSVLKKIL